MNKGEKIFFGLIAVIIVIVLGALIFWGLGNLVIWVFKIDYVWTIWHGLVAEFVFILLKDIFSRKEE